MANRQSLSTVRELLNRQLGPRRDAAIAMSDAVQELNRLAFVEQQSAVAESQRAAEARGWRELSAALVIGLGALLVMSAYAGRLEERLRRRQMRHPATAGSTSRH
jgi:hypothetical protein